MRVSSLRVIPFKVGRFLKNSCPKGLKDKLRWVKPVRIRL